MTIILFLGTDYKNTLKVLKPKPINCKITKIAKNNFNLKSSCFVIAIYLELCQIESKKAQKSCLCFKLFLSHNLPFVLSKYLF